MTLIRQHFDQSIAAAASTDSIDINALSVYQRLYKSLKDDKAILKNIASIQDKIKAKAAMIPNYSDWIQGVIDTGRAAEDPAAFGRLCVETSELRSTSETKSLNALLSTLTASRLPAARIIICPALRAALKAVFKNGFMVFFLIQVKYALMRRTRHTRGC